MHQSDELMHFSAKPAQKASRQPDRPRGVVPGYTLYGDSAPKDWRVNVEPLERRARERNWQIDPHMHPGFFQLVVVDTGSGKLSLDDATTRFSGSTIIVVPPFHIHSFDYAETSRGVVLTVENVYAGELAARAPELRRVFQTGGCFALSRPSCERLLKEFIALGAELNVAQQGWKIASEIHLLTVLLIVLRERVNEETFQTGNPELVDSFLRIVEENYRQQPDLERIAAELSISVNRLRQVCKRCFGTTPLAIVHDRILTEAKRCLIYTSMSVSSISFWLGFDSPSYFSRFFNQRVGQAPSDFRRNAIS